jgi:hypothetical protein
VRRLLRWAVWTIGGVNAVLIVTVIATARFGDRALYPPPAGDARVEVFVAANFYHSGIIFPRDALADVARRRNLVALTVVTEKFSGYPRLEFGWGDEGFYTRVPTSAELTTALALRALFRPGNPSVMHVVGLAEYPRAIFPEASMVVLWLGGQGFDRLAVALDRAFARNGRDGTIDEMGRGL